MRRRVWPAFLVALLALAVGTLVAIPLSGALSSRRAKGIKVLLKADTTGQNLSTAQLEEVLDNTEKIITTRIKALGGANAEVERIGDLEFEITVYGTDDFDRLQALVGNPGKLELRLVADSAKTNAVFGAIDVYVQGGQEVRYRPFSRMLVDVYDDVAVESENYQALQFMLDDAHEAVPADVEVLFGDEEEWTEASSVRNIMRVYVVQKEPQGVGADVKSADPDPYMGSDPVYTGTWQVEIEFTNEGKVKFSEVTANNIGRRLAVVFDDEVKIAPFIRERIPPTANPVITSQDRSGYETRDLAAMISSGALAIPLEVVETSSVNPGSAKGRASVFIIIGGLLLLSIIVFVVVYFLTNKKAKETEEFARKEV